MHGGYIFIRKVQKVTKATELTGKAIFKGDPSTKEKLKKGRSEAYS
jgi:hypothetical protein